MHVRNLLNGCYANGMDLVSRFSFLSGSINKGGGHEIRVGASFPFVRLSYFHESLKIVGLTPLNYLAERHINHISLAFFL